ncbi:hypothetical protein PHK61_29380 [Actinomycetospora lutea]|uniref:hypothetical protein n=1 Tax=Actinomycetospora lutea TaxID=663604 RepID=UPI00236675AA|nr:hypothetical protein [Actinomycetospora lutea]MDD7942532.1 hypothetical protein [Actinomycetospora lutea]
MRGRRSSRSAAVVLAGCVGLAVIAPGLALAAPVAGVTSEAECEDLGVGYTWVNGVCDDGETAVVEDEDTTSAGDEDVTLPAGEDTTPPAGEDTTPPAGEDTTPPAGEDTTPPAGEDTTPPAGDEEVTPPAGDDEVTPPADDEEVTPPADDEEVTPPAGDQEVTPPAGNDDATPPAGNDDATPPAGDEQAPAPKADAVEDVIPDLQQEIDDILPDAGANPIKLPGLPTIPQPVDGTFTNVNDACLNAISKLEFPAGTTGLERLSAQLQGFCYGLNTTDVHVCLEHLRDVIKHLCPTVIEYNTTINFINTHVSYEWWGAYWTHRYDVDCDEVTYDEANAILDWDRSDPFRLDRDDDGIACERNAHEHEVDYVSYPEGGVSTGDGSTSTGASPVEVALAAGALGGLGAIGLVLVRRYARQG